MGNNINGIIDDPIKNLTKSNIMSLEFEKEFYYESQECKGFVDFHPLSSISFGDILIRMRVMECWVYYENEKKTHSEINNQVILEQKLNCHQFFNLQVGQSIQLPAGTYKIPFSFILPKNLQPSFELPIPNRSAYLRYTLTAELLSSFQKTMTQEFILIKSRPIIIPTAVKHDNYKKVYDIGIIPRGKSGISLSMVENNYKINDIIPLTVDIDNTNCDRVVSGIKLTLKRHVVFYKKNEEYPFTVKIFRKKYDVFIQPGSKGTFRYEIQLRDSELKGFVYRRELNPYYKQINDLNLLLPSLNSNLFKCDYKLKATTYFDFLSRKGSRPRIEVPLYVTAQLKTEYEVEKHQILENEKKLILQPGTHDYNNSMAIMRSKNVTHNVQNNFNPGLNRATTFDDNKKYSYQDYLKKKGNFDTNNSLTNMMNNNNNNNNSLNNQINNSINNNLNNSFSMGNNFSFGFNNNNNNPYGGNNYNNNNNNPYGGNNFNNNNNPYGGFNPYENNSNGGGNNNYNNNFNNPYNNNNNNNNFNNNSNFNNNNNNNNFNNNSNFNNNNNNFINNSYNNNNNFNNPFSNQNNFNQNSMNNNFSRNDTFPSQNNNSMNFRNDGFPSNNNNNNNNFNYPSF